MPVLLGAMIVGAVLAGWYTVTLKPPAARANLFSDLTTEAKPQESGVRALGDRLRRFVPTSLVKNMEADLAQAGHPHGIDLPKLLGIQALIMVVLFILCLLIGYPLAAFGAIPAGFIIPRYWISKQKAVRQDAVSAAVSDTLDQLTIMVESGLGFDAALMRVVSTNEGPLSAELAHTVSDMRAGVPRDQALRALAERTQVPEIKTVTQALIQAQRHGTPLADILRVQAAEIRDKRKQAVEEQAAKLGTKLIFPMALFFFPAFFVMALGPAVAAIIGAFS